MYRDAFRLLCILLEGSEAIEDGATAEGHDRIFKGEKRAQALVFYVSYPDYLADRLLDLHDAGVAGMLEEAGAIFDRDEPDARLSKMIRWRHGAYFDLDDALGVLSYRGLVRPVRKTLSNLAIRHDYLIGPAAAAFLEAAARAQHGLTWYVERARLAVRVCGSKTGHVLKAEQYAFEEYGGTRPSGVIPSIAARVRARLDAARSGA